MFKVFKSFNVHPPSGYVCIDPDTHFKFGPFGKKQELMDAIIDYRKKNNLEPLADLNYYIQDYMCRLPINKSAGICKDVPRLQGLTPQQLYSGGKFALAKKIKSVFGFGGDNPELTQITDRRLGCIDCPLHVPLEYIEDGLNRRIDETKQQIEEAKANNSLSPEDTNDAIAFLDMQLIDLRQQLEEVGNAETRKADKEMFEFRRELDDQMADEFPDAVTEHDEDKFVEIMEHMCCKYYQGFLWSNYADIISRTMFKNMYYFKHPEEGKVPTNYMFQSIGAFSNAGKTHTVTAFYVIFYLRDPSNTAIFLTSNKLESTRERVWSDFYERFSEIQRAYPELFNKYNFKVNDSTKNMRVQYREASAKWVVKAFSLNSDVNEKKIIDSLGGRHEGYIFMAIDEATSCSTAVLEAAKNMSLNHCCLITTLNNPDSPNNLPGHIGKPLWGYEKHDYDKYDIYQNDWGFQCYLNPYKSPAILHKDLEVREKFKAMKFPTLESIEADKNNPELGEEQFYRMTLGRIRLADSDGGLLSAKTIDLYDMTRPAEFAPNAPIVNIIAIDPSKGKATSDLCPIIVARLGMATDGYMKLCFGGLLQTNDYFKKLTTSKKHRGKEIYEIVRQAKDFSGQFPVKIKDISFDSAGAGVDNIFYNEWSDDLRGINGGGRVSKTKHYGKSTANSLFRYKVDEIYWNVQRFANSGQLCGVPQEALDVLLSRKIFYESSKYKVEPKTDWMQRTRSKSPDICDIVGYALDTAVYNYDFSLQKTKIEDINNRLSTAKLENIKQASENIKPKPVALKELRSMSFRKKNRRGRGSLKLR